MFLFLQHILQGCPGWLWIKRDSLLLGLQQGSVLSIKRKRESSVFTLPPKMCSPCCPGNGCCFSSHPPPGMVKFIDYEYADYNYQAFDIGNHFNEFAGKCALRWKEAQFASNFFFYFFFFTARTYKTSLMWNIKWRRSCVYSVCVCVCDVQGHHPVCAASLTMISFISVLYVPWNYVLRLKLRRQTAVFSMDSVRP